VFEKSLYNLQGGKNMTILEKVRDVFVECEIGAVYSTKEIKEMVRAKYDIKEGSIIPSDYCYNLVNKGKLADPALEKFKIFEWISRGKYRYLGENYVYKGFIHSYPRRK
jgi:hypothetical protein